MWKLIDSYKIFKGYALGPAILFCCMPAYANQVGHDTQTFHPVAGKQEYTTVQSASVLGAKALGVGLFLNHAKNTLPFSADTVDKSNNFVTSMDFVASYGLNQTTELGLALPFNVYQSIESAETHSEFLDQGNTEIRPYGKVVIFDRYPYKLASVLHLGINRMGSNPYTGKGAGLSLSGELVFDYLINSKLSVSGNIGYRWQDQGNPEDPAIIDPIGSRLLYSGAANFEIKRKHSLVAEAYGSTALTDHSNSTDRTDSNLETLGTWQWQFKADTISQLGMSLSPIQGLSAPDLRIFAGIHHTMKPKVKKIAKSKKKKRKTIARKKPKKKKVRKRRVIVRKQPALPVIIEPKQITTAQIPARKADKVIVLSNVNFEFDKDNEILKGGSAELDRVAEYLNSVSYDQVIIEGHCDYIGSHSYNDNLGLRRARNIARHLVMKKGQDVTRIKYISFGERRPKTADSSRYGRAINRRIEIKVYQSGSLLMATD